MIFSWVNRQAAIYLDVETVDSKPQTLMRFALNSSSSNNNSNSNHHDDYDDNTHRHRHTRKCRRYGYGMILRSKFGIQSEQILNTQTTPPPPNQLWQLS